MSTSLAGIDLGVRRAIATAESGFFLTAHTILLGLVLIGFAPTFFLRAFFDVPPIPATLYVHGAVMALWFAFGPLQGWLMRKGERKWHRRLGYVAAAYASAFVVLGIVANSRLTARLESLDDPANIIIWGNYFTLVLFTTFVSLAILFRKRPEAHKRLALLASVAVIGPALGRFPMWSIFAGGMDAGRNFAIGGLLVMLVSLIVYDVLARRRPHPATWLGAFAIVISIVAAVALGLSPTGFEMLHGSVGT
jgi:hypothetical protein